MASNEGSDGSRADWSRRRFIARAGLAGAAAWTTPLVLSSPASAGGTAPVVPPAFVAGSTATAFSGPDISNKQITLTSGNVAVGDLWLGILAYDFRGSLVAPAGAGWSTTANFTGGDGIYSVRSMVVWRILTAADVPGSSFSFTFEATGADLTYGGFRGAGLAYRGTDLVAAVNGDGVTQGGGITASTASVTFPTAVPAGVAPNVVVRLGAARGYGGYLAGSPINWTASPGTQRVSYDTSNNGDRALRISEQIDNVGTSGAGTYFTALAGARHRATFTAVIRNGP